MAQKYYVIYILLTQQCGRFIFPLRRKRTILFKLFGGVAGGLLINNGAKILCYLYTFDATMWKVYLSVAAETHYFI
jgi:hypothetical protein